MTSLHMVNFYVRQSVSGGPDTLPHCQAGKIDQYESDISFTWSLVVFRNIFLSENSSRDVKIF